MKVNKRTKAQQINPRGADNKSDPEFRESDEAILRIAKGISAISCILVVYTGNSVYFGKTFKELSEQQHDIRY